MIVVGGLAAHIDHGVDRRRAADHLAARIIQAASVEARLRLGLEHPVRARIADGEQVADRNVKPDPIVAAAGFEDQHALAGVGRKPVGEQAAGRTRADDDVIVVAFDCLLPRPCFAPRAATDSMRRGKMMRCRFAIGAGPDCYRAKATNGAPGACRIGPGTTVPQGVSHRPYGSGDPARIARARHAFGEPSCSEKALLSRLSPQPLPVRHCRSAPGAAHGAGQIHHRLRRRFDEERARRCRRGLHQEERRQGRRQLRRKLGADETDRRRRAGRCVRFRRSEMDGLRVAEKAHQGRHPRQSPRQ